MKNTGIARRVDELGRIVLPKELRRTMNIKEGDPLEIHVDDNSIVLKPICPDDCIYCHSDKNLVGEPGKYICPKCIEKLRREVLSL